MALIRMVSIMHLLWGITLAFLPAPRPFGSLEPYFQLVEPPIVGLIFFLAGVVPLVAIRTQAFRCLACALAPQQIVLTYGTAVTAWDVITTQDTRSILAFCYLAPMTVLHCLEGIDVAMHLWRGRAKDGNLDG